MVSHSRISVMIKKYLKIFLAIISINLAIPNTAIAIEGGQDASGNEFTVFIVSQWNSTKISTCTGALLNDYVVVTAAHCLNDETGLISKAIKIAPPGSTIEYNTDGALLMKNEWVEADSTQVTVTYQSGSSQITDDDLAFLTLKTPLKSNALVRIASEDEMLKLKSASSPLKLYGYGVTSDSGKKANSPSYFNAEFENRTHPLANSAYAKSSIGAGCVGDSGGPVVNITPTQILVVGVITGGSISNNCSTKSSDGVYRATFTILNRYANLAFATVSRISSNLGKLKQTESELLESKAQIMVLQEEISSWTSNYSDLESKLNEALSEIEKLKAQLTRTIICTKGLSTKKVTAINPKCPTGFKIKN